MNKISKTGVKFNDIFVNKTKYTKNYDSLIRVSVELKSYQLFYWIKGVF